MDARHDSTGTGFASIKAHMRPRSREILIRTYRSSMRFLGFGIRDLTDVHAHRHFKHGLGYLCGSCVREVFPPCTLVTSIPPGPKLSETTSNTPKRADARRGYVAVGNVPMHTLEVGQDGLRWRDGRGTELGVLHSSRLTCDGIVALSAGGS